jgi:hypothetical protein
MSVSERTVRYIIAIILMAFLVLFIMKTARADKESVTNYTTNNYTEVVELTELKPVFQSNHCSGVAIGQAAANNHIFSGVNKYTPQLSLGFGECDGEVAGSLMLGMKLKKNTVISGSYARDENIDAVGFGITIIIP